MRFWQPYANGTDVISFHLSLNFCFFLFSYFCCLFFSIFFYTKERTCKLLIRFNFSSINIQIIWNMSRLNGLRHECYGQSIWIWALGSCFRFATFFPEENEISLWINEDIFFAIFVSNWNFQLKFLNIDIHFFPSVFLCSSLFFYIPFQFIWIWINCCDILNVNYPSHTEGEREKLISVLCDTTYLSFFPDFVCL